MPIAFPPSLQEPLFQRRQWLALATKWADMVAAPNMGSPGLAFGKTAVGKFDPRSLDPGLSVMANRATNLRNLRFVYQAPDQNSIVNPAALFDELYDETTGFDRDLGQQNIRIIGVSRDAVGAALGVCVVKVFRTSDDVLVASTISDGSGNWTAYPNQVGPYYFVEYKAGAPDVFGTSPNTNGATTFTPGQ
jgi:hypothetical protein